MCLCVRQTNVNQCGLNARSENDDFKQRRTDIRWLLVRSWRKLKAQRTGARRQLITQEREELQNAFERPALSVQHWECFGLARPHLYSLTHLPKLFRLWVRGRWSLWCLLTLCASAAASSALCTASASASATACTADPGFKERGLTLEQYWILHQFRTDGCHVIYGATNCMHQPFPSQPKLMQHRVTGLFCVLAFPAVAVCTVWRL